MKKFLLILVLLLLYAGLLCVESERIAALCQSYDLGGFAYAEVTEPSAKDKYITKAVSALMQKHHISERELDDELSERTISAFLKALDPQKLYFYQQDIDTIRKAQPNLRDFFRTGELRLAYIIFKTYIARMQERVGMMQEALDMPMDFTIDETMIVEPDELSYPKNKIEALERVRLRVKYDMLLLQMDDLKAEKNQEEKAASDAPVTAPAGTPAAGAAPAGTPAADAAPAGTPATDAAPAGTPATDAAPAAPASDAAPAEEPKTPEEKLQANKDKLKKRYSSFQKRMEQLDNEELLEFYLTAMCNSYDPHSSYMSPSTLENFEISMSLGLQGIGATLTSEDGYVVVKHLVPGGPAEKEGSLKINDKICGVAQDEDGPMEDVVDMKLDDVVKKIRGKADTVVRLEVIPGDGGAKKIVRIVRSNIELKDSEAKGVVFEAGTKPDGKPYKIGVINLPSFYLDMQANRMFGGGKNSTSDVKRILEDFNAQGVDSVVLDLRNNGGGSLQEAIRLTGLFIDTGCVVQVRDSENEIQSHRDFMPGVSWDGPLVVVINQLSASASEILAGAIKDYGRGLIVGDRTTHGKGTVQTVDYLGQRLLGNNSPKLGALKVTIQQFYRPLGDSTQNNGVASDIEIPSLTTHMDIGEADLDYPLAFHQIAAQDITPWQGGPTQPMIQKLAANSAQRVAAEPEFQKLQKKVNFYLDIKDQKEVTLNLEKFMAERADVLQEEEKELEEQITSDANEIKRDYYMNEVLAIMTDYMKALGK